VLNGGVLLELESFLFDGPSAESTTGDLYRDPPNVQTVPGSGPIVNMESQLRLKGPENDEGILQMVMKLFLFIYTTFLNSGVGVSMYKMCATYVCKCIIIFTLSRMALAKSNVRKLDCMMKL
jgi:hypothetical protein